MPDENDDDVEEPIVSVKSHNDDEVMEGEEDPEDEDGSRYDGEE
jgi:hypothetical protein